MKLALAAALALAFTAPAPDARFGPDGLHLGETLVKGPAIDLRETPDGYLLASGNVVEPVSCVLRLSVAPDRTLVLEPGIRATRAEGGVTLTAQAGRSMRIGDRALDRPATLTPTATGWRIEDAALEGRELHAGLAPVEGRVQVVQQDPDRNLEDMRRSAGRIEQAQRQPPPQRRLNQRRVFREDPTVLSEAVESQTLRFLTSLPVVSPN